MTEFIAFFQGATPGFQLAALIFIIYQIHEMKAQMKELKDSHHDVAKTVAVLDAKGK